MTADIPALSCPPPLLTVHEEKKGFDMGAFWNPRGGVVLGDKERTKKELSDLKGMGLVHLPMSVGPVVKWWKKFKMVVILFTPLR